MRTPVKATRATNSPAGTFMIRNSSTQTKAEILLLSNQTKAIANRISVIAIDNTFRFSKLANNSLVASDKGLTLGNNSNVDNSFVVWSKLSYDYYNGSSMDSFSTPNITLGGEYNFGKNNDYKFGLAYTYGFINNNSNHNSVSLYTSVDNINIGDSFKNNLASAIATYGNLKDTSEDNKHNMNLISFDTKFGHKIKLSANDVLIPMLGIRYDYIDRNDVSYFANVVTPIAGMMYGRNFLNDNLNIKVFLNVEYNFNLGNNSSNSANIIVYNNKIITSVNKNTFAINADIGINYKVKNNIDLTFDTNGSYNTDKIYNIGFSIGGKLKF